MENQEGLAMQTIKMSNIYKQDKVLVQKLSRCEFDERNSTKRIISKVLKENCGST